jgi:hypothetical protein
MGGGGGLGVKSVCRFVDVTVNSKEDFWSHYVQEFDLWIKICSAQYTAIADVSQWKKIIFLPGEGMGPLEYSNDQT